MRAEAKAAPRGGVLLVRMITAAVALVVIVGFLVDVAMTVIAQESGTPTTNAVLNSPLLFLFYAGPTLVVLLMTSRSRSMLAALVTLAMAVLFAALLVYNGAPWHFKRWHGNSDMTWVGLGQLVLVWPGTLIVWALWMAVNRSPKA